MKRILGLILFSLVLVPLLHAEELEEDLRVSDMDPTTWSVRIGAMIPSIPLHLSPAEGSSGLKDVLYEQNVGGKMGLGFDYRWIGFYLSLVPIVPQDSLDFGDTKYNDLQFHLYGKWYAVDLYYQDFDGYYLDNSTEIFPSTYTGESHYLRPDIRTRFVGANFMYFFSPDKLSMPAAAGNVAFQRKGGGSWSLFAGYGEQNVGSDSPLAPVGYEQNYGVIGNMLDGSFKTLALGGGYGYNFSWGSKWQLLVSAQAGLGPQWQNIRTQDMGNFDEVKFSFKSNTRVSLGQNGDKIFWAVQGIIDTTTFDSEDGALNFISSQTFFFFGHRF